VASPQTLSLLLVVAPQRLHNIETVNLSLQRRPARLTSREREVLALVATGISNKGIARQLQVSPNTVKFHIAAILDKLDAATRAEAVAAAVRRGELSL
jgi:DNA-binding NarL/FixJ family response regulator